MIKLIIGGQFGSEGKGSVCSWLCKNEKFDLVIRTGAPNAGHTFVTKKNKEYVMRQIPVSWAFQDSPLYLPSGCVIDPRVLQEELDWIQLGGFTGKVLINANASIIEDDAIKTETEITTGTTGKGVGATRAKECMRLAKLVRDWSPLTQFLDHHNLVHDILKCPTSNILIESTQGFGLSLDCKFYPYCTSNNLMPYQILQDADIPFGAHNIEVWMVIRTFPIRISGNSGPLYEETSWANLRGKHGSHIKDEYTSVTKKLRRVGEFNPEPVIDAIDRCNPNRLVLTFIDYPFPLASKGILDNQVHTYIKAISRMIRRRVDYIGIGVGRILKYEPLD